MLCIVVFIRSLTTFVMKIDIIEPCLHLFYLNSCMHSCLCVCAHRYIADSPFSPPNHNQNVVRSLIIHRISLHLRVYRERVCWTMCFQQFFHNIILTHTHNTNRHHHHHHPRHRRPKNKTYAHSIPFYSFPSPMAFQIFINSTLMEYNIRGGRWK